MDNARKTLTYLQATFLLQAVLYLLFLFGLFNQSSHVLFYRVVFLLHTVIYYITFPLARLNWFDFVPSTRGCKYLSLGWVKAGVVVLFLPASVELGLLLVGKGRGEEYVWQLPRVGAGLLVGIDCISISMSHSLLKSGVRSSSLLCFLTDLR